jgi:ribosomal protein S18 acetylase RimI-like enzyme
MSPTPILDELIANAWPAQIDVEHEGWRFRWTSGVSRRANSVLAVGSDELVPELVAEAEEFYRRRDCPPRFQVSTASAPDRLAAYLAARGYIAEAPTLVERAATDEVIDRTGAGAWEICATDRPSDDWFDAYWAMESSRGRSAADARIYREVLLRPPAPTRFVAASDDHEVHSVGQTVIDRGFAGVQCVATHPARRRLGAAFSVLHHLAVESSARGAHEMYLAVMADNGGARRMYEGAGFAVDHEYRYFSPR